MRGGQLVAQVPDLVDGQRRRRVRVDHGRRAHQAWVALDGCAHGQVDRAEEVAVQRRALRRQVADLHRVRAERVQQFVSMEGVEFDKDTLELEKAKIMAELIQAANKQTSDLFGHTAKLVSSENRTKAGTPEKTLKSNNVTPLKR